MHLIYAADDGIWSGNVTLADVCFLAAFIVFLVGAFVAFTKDTVWATLIAVGLALVAVGWLVL
jgi:hypothetical protein